MCPINPILLILHPESVKGVQWHWTNFWVKGWCHSRPMFKILVGTIYFFSLSPNLFYTSPAENLWIKGEQWLNGSYIRTPRKILVKTTLSLPLVLSCSFLSLCLWVKGVKWPWTKFLGQWLMPYQISLIYSFGP